MPGTDAGLALSVLHVVLSEQILAFPPSRAAANTGLLVSRATKIDSLAILRTD